MILEAQLSQTFIMLGFGLVNLNQNQSNQLSLNITSTKITYN